MVRKLFFLFCLVSIGLLVYGIRYNNFVLTDTAFFTVPIMILGIADIMTNHNLLRNYPVIGHFRYMFEFIRPEIQQYFVATNLSGRPFNREQRSLVYQRAKQVDDTHPFGTEHDVHEPFYASAPHSIHTRVVPESELRVMIGKEHCKQPYLASRLNISAMSFGAISARAILALNRGAKLGGFCHNTGEGSLSPYHLEEGGDLIWQIGTGYFGCRTKTGTFDPKQFEEKSQNPQVKMIEIKISQGAKPSHGGLLPAAKISKEIAETRGIPVHQDCLSPTAHSLFNTPRELLHTIAKLRELSGGKPVGFKLCIGRKSEFVNICKAMLDTGITPDFITVDGAEGGTGAAPIEFTNRLGTPINQALYFVHTMLLEINLRQKIKVIASGKVVSGFDMALKLGLGADLCNSARAMMFAIGCIQAQSCNTNRCPTGVATQDPTRQRAIVVPDRAQRVKNYHHATLESLRELAGAMGFERLDDLSPNDFYYQTPQQQSIPYSEVFPRIEPGSLLSGAGHPRYQRLWDTATAERF